VKVEVDDVNDDIDDVYENPSLDFADWFEERAILAQI
jgi:hypothetical protein